MRLSPNLYLKSSHHRELLRNFVVVVLCAVEFGRLLRARICIIQQLDERNEIQASVHLFLSGDIASGFSAKFLLTEAVFKVLQITSGPLEPLQH